MESHYYSLTINKDKHVNEIFANVAQFSIYPKKRRVLYQICADRIYTNSLVPFLKQ
jgi:hypothetical protein